LRSKNYAQEFEKLSTGMRVGQWDLGIDDFMRIPALVPLLEEQEAIANYLDEQVAYIDTAVEEARNSIDDYKKWKFSTIFEAVTKGLDPNVKKRESGIKWIGEMPADWSVRVLFQLVTQVKNKNSDLAEQNLLSLSYGKIKRKNIETTDGLLPASFDGYNVIEADDIVLRLTDLQNDHTSLRVGRATERGIITSAYVTIRPMEGVNSEYLYYVLHAFDLKKGLYGMGSGVRQGLNYDEVKLIKIPFAPKELQNQIVAYLNEQCQRIDSVIEEKQELISELESYKHSLIYEAVTGKRKVV
jgi:type I restriction enzyme S subunit